MKPEIWGAIREGLGDTTPKLFSGLLDRCDRLNMELAAHIREGKDFLYVDNAYFGRGARSRNFRLIRKGLHMTRALERPGDRRARWGLEPEPWRKDGRDIVVIPPSPYHIEIYGAHEWLQTTLSKLWATTDRPVIVKTDKRTPLREALANAWAVVTYSSVAGVEAALWGVPVFSGPHCPSRPVAAGSLARIESPEYRDREPWLNSLAYATWSLDELSRIKLKDYRYQCVS